MAPAALYERTQEVTINTIDSIQISGTLEYVSNKKLAIMLAGSGPTDRDCNSAIGLASNTFKYIADELAAAGISSYRYDKRGIAASTKVPESRMTLYDRIVDIKAIVDRFQNDFEEITLIGHSEGVIVGTVAATEHPSVDAFVGIAGPSNTMKEILMEQMAKYPKLTPLLEMHFEELENDLPYSEVNPLIKSLFNESLRPYMQSAIAMDPSENIAKLSKPTLIIGGTCDVQVAPEHAKTLHKNCPGSELLIVEGMGHVLKELEADCSNAQKAYQDDSLPLNKEFVEGLMGFMSR